MIRMRGGALITGSRSLKSHWCWLTVEEGFRKPPLRILDKLGTGPWIPPPSPSSSSSSFPSFFLLRLSFRVTPQWFPLKYEITGGKFVCIACHKRKNIVWSRGAVRFTCIIV
ncbi:hypothetical protein CEXT_797151 [Caerostris extrusa]|uniref:Uncharacterized protein n=1 Tax=Caerostris extrusa TaxID=172846 RepID=A0AAV4P366_CAEEX|nr:hypothetical protein CEXT_797151 [Caerostris extrusa]